MIAVVWTYHVNNSKTSMINEWSFVDSDSFMMQIFFARTLCQCFQLFSREMKVFWRCWWSHKSVNRSQIYKTRSDTLLIAVCIENHNKYIENSYVNDHLILVYSLRLELIIARRINYEIIRNETNQIVYDE